MTADQLAGDAVDHPGKLKTPFFARQLAVIHHLKQQIAQLALQVFKVTLLDGIGDLVGLFKGVGHDRLVGLLDVPRTTVLRVTQPGHEMEQVVEVVHRGSLLMCTQTP